MAVPISMKTFLAREAKLKNSLNLQFFFLQRG